MEWISTDRSVVLSLGRKVDGERHGAGFWRSETHFGDLSAAIYSTQALEEPAFCREVLMPPLM
jgi:hypothetical protein